MFKRNMLRLAMVAILVIICVVSLSAQMRLPNLRGAADAAAQAEAERRAAEAVAGAEPVVSIGWPSDEVLARHGLVELTKPYGVDEVVTTSQGNTFGIAWEDATKDHFDAMKRQIQGIEGTQLISEEPTENGYIAVFITPTMNIVTVAFNSETETMGVVITSM